MSLAQVFILSKSYIIFVSLICMCIQIVLALHVYYTSLWLGSWLLQLLKHVHHLSTEQTHLHSEHSAADHSGLLYLFTFGFDSSAVLWV